MYSKDFRVYPNPSNGVFNVDINQNGQHRLQLLDVNGAAIWKEVDYALKTFNIDISDKPNGLYILSIENLKNSERSYFKILKMN